jgi:predicted glycoside hydrolase/deacetylase ChbG (UPF0249 family)
LRRLIINADDLGLTAGINRAIAECVRAGMVTSTTLMANAAAFADAVSVVQELAASNPGFRDNQRSIRTGKGIESAFHANAGDDNSDTAPAGNTRVLPKAGTSQGAAEDGKPRRPISVGCHVVLVDGSPVLPPQDVSSLLTNGTGEFRTSFAAFARAELARRVDSDQVGNEVEAQLRRLQSSGVQVSHIDTHKHVHLFPRELKPLLKAARTCGVRAVRNPFAPVKPLTFAHLVRRPHLWKRYTEVKVLRGWNQAFQCTVEAEGMMTTDGSFGIVSTGALDLELFRAIIGCIPEGTWELCCHPGYNDSDLDRVRTRLRASRDREREILTSAAAREIVAQHGIELISYWEVGS